MSFSSQEIDFAGVYSNWSWTSGLLFVKGDLSMSDLSLFG